MQSFSIYNLLHETSDSTNNQEVLFDKDLSPNIKNLNEGLSNFKNGLGHEENPIVYVWSPELCSGPGLKPEPLYANLKRLKINQEDEKLSEDPSHSSSSDSDDEIDSEISQQTLLDEQILTYQFMDPNFTQRTFYFKCLSKPKRSRTTYSTIQLIQLERIFRHNPYLVGEDRKRLARCLDLSEAQIKVWFQNRRTKDRKQKISGVFHNHDICKNEIELN